MVCKIAKYEVKSKNIWNLLVFLSISYIVTIERYSATLINRLAVPCGRIGLDIGGHICPV